MQNKKTKKGKCFVLMFFLSAQIHAQVVEVVAGLSSPYGLAVDSASNLYISETNKISFVFLNDAVPTVFDLFTNNVGNPTQLKIDSNYLYVVETGSNEISRFNLLSGPPQLTPYITSGLTSPRAIALTGNNLVVGDYGSYSIKKINVAVAPFQISLLDNDLATDIVIDGGVFYYANPVYGAVKSNTIINPSPNSAQVVTDILHPSSLLLHEGLLYISDSQEGKIYRINPNGPSTTSQLIASGLNEPQGMVVYNNSLYIAERGANRIVRLSLNSLNNQGFGDVTSFNVSPNPAQNILNIDTSEIILEVKAFDLLGKEVSNTKVPNHSIDVSGLENGIYILRITTPERVAWQKIIKK